MLEPCRLCPYWRTGMQNPIEVIDFIHEIEQEQEQQQQQYDH